MPHAAIDSQKAKSYQRCSKLNSKPADLALTHNRTRVTSNARNRSGLSVLWGSMLRCAFPQFETRLSRSVPFPRGGHGRSRPLPLNAYCNDRSRLRARIPAIL
jgi:hypothetical protein